MSLIVMHAGAESRIVDAGRPRSRSLGIPLGGAADRVSFALGNALVGNGPEAAALEFCLVGPRLRAEVELACVVMGAPFELAANDRTLRVGSTFTLQPGEVLRIGGTPKGLRAYLCVWGGFHTPTVLSSQSSLEPIRANDLLACDAGHIRTRWLPHSVPSFEDLTIVRVVAGLQADWFQAEDFYSQAFMVRPESNRMGIRLAGQALTLPDRELVSEPVAPGAVQVTRDGQCILLGVDGQTIGGYPKIAHVIRADLHRIGQLRPGSRVRFEAVTLPEAVELDRESQRLLRNQLVRLQVSLDGDGGDRKLQ